MKLVLLFLVVWISIAYTVKAQEVALVDFIGHEEEHTNDKSLGYDLLKGRFTFHMRSYFMQTFNKGKLSDYNSLAKGAGLGYYSPSWKGFHVGFSGYFVFQIFENNIANLDPITGNVNRYEILLYDKNDPHNKHDLDRMEELYISYEKTKWKLELGRQKINTPLLNEQDNRMRPNIFSGFTTRYNAEDLQVIAAWLTSATLRGTVDWYSIEDSFGVYPFGRSPQGVSSDYLGNISSAGIGILGISYQKEGETKKVKLQGWNYLAQNVFNLGLGQVDFTYKPRDITYQVGLQGFFQNPINEGGNNDQIKAYIQKDEISHGIGTKLGLQFNENAFSFNYLHIGNQGRFLFPREWGRETFYASLPRERFEGSGGVEAIAIKYKREIPNQHLHMELGVGKVNMPSEENFELNKYGVPSYYHFVYSLDYDFTGYLEGMKMRILAVNKTAQNTQQIEDRYRINRVDLWNLNLIFDYTF